MDLIASFHVPLWWSLTLTFCAFLFTMFVKKRKYFWVKFPLSIVTLMVVQTFAFYGLSHIETNIDLVTSINTVLFFFLEVAMIAGLIFMCFKVNVKEAVFFTVASYSLEHFVNAIKSFILFPITESGIVLSSTLVHICFDLLFKMVLAFFVYWFFLKPYLEKYAVSEIVDNRVLVISSINLCICVVLSVFKTYPYHGAVNSFTTEIICNTYALFGCFLCLYLQFSYFIDTKLTNDNKTMDMLFKEQIRANQLSKENIELINIKFHDLKKQIRRLQESQLTSEDVEVVEGIKKSISIYDSFVKTGNGALDSILMNSYLSSVNKQIDFTYFVDGEILNSLDSTDVISMFDNLLANAFDAVSGEEVSNRVIHLQVHKEKQMVMIHMRNYCGEKPKFIHGIPVTKGNPKYHGYGMKSISRIVDKYNGNMKCSWREEFFSVNILIPIPDVSQ